MFFAIVLCLSLVYAVSEIDFTYPTPVENANLSEGNDLEINVTIDEQNLTGFNWTWNNVDYVFMDSSLALMYNFDKISLIGENSTKVFDLSGNNRDGVVTGATWTSDGKYGGAYSFDGNGDGINVGDIEMDNWNNLYISAWIKTSDTSNTQRIIGKDQVGVQGNFLFWFQGGSWKFQANTGSGWALAAYSSTAPNDGQWHHFIGMVDEVNNEISLYIDGVKVASNTWTQNTLDDSQNEEIVIGADSDVGSYEHVFNGQIDEIRIYDRAMNNGEIAQQYVSNLRKYDISKWLFYTVQSNLANGTYDFSVSGIDVGGDINSTSRTVNVGFIEQEDTLSPVIQGSEPIDKEVLDAGVTNIMINITTDENAICRYNITDESWDSMVEMDSTNSTIHRLTINGLENGTTYNYYFLCEDEGNNRMNESYSLEFSVDDGLLPSIDGELSIDFTNPTPADNANVTGNVEINASIFGANMSQLIFNWDGVNYSLYDESIVAMFNFDDNEANDISLNNNDGAVTGATWTSDGKYGGAYSFDGNDDAINLGDIEADNWEDIAISAWIKTSDTSNTQRIMGKDQVGVQGNFLFWFQGGGWKYQVLDEEGNWDLATYSSTAPNDGQWHHMIGTTDNANNKIYLYVDGVKVAESTFSASTLDDSQNEEIVIGADSDVGSYEHVFNGNFDEIILFNRSLDANEVKQIYYSNLKKFDNNSWMFYTKQQGLQNKSYNYQVNVKSLQGVINSTEMRGVNIESNVTSPPEPSDEIGHFKLWVATDPHVQTDLPGYHSYESAINDSLYGGDEGGESFDWDISINAGDYTGDQQCPGETDGYEYMEQINNSGVDINKIYGILGNHDGTTNNYWLNNWIDPLGKNTATSGINQSLRPYVVRGNDEYYYFEVGNILFLMLNDWNQPGQSPFGRECSGGYPAGRVRNDTYNWWVQMVEDNEDKIIITTFHQALYNTTIYTGFKEGYEQGIHGGHTWADKNGSSMLYAIENWTIDGLNENAEFIGERNFGFRKYIEDNPGAIDMWLHGHTHNNLYPGETYNGRSDIETVDGVHFVNNGMIGKAHAGPEAPFSRLYYFYNNSKNLTIKTYMHSTGWGSVQEGFYSPVETALFLSKPFNQGYLISNLTDVLVESEDGLEDFSEDRKYGLKEVALRDDGELVANFTVNFSSEMNWNDVRGNIDSENARTYIELNKEVHTEIIDNATIRVPIKVGTGNVIVCPNAVSISNVTQDCMGGYGVEGLINESGYYHIILNSGGVIENSTVSVNEAYVDDDYNESSCNFAGHTWNVDCFNNIQDAIDAVEDAGIININSGTYESPLNIQDRINISLIGESSASVLINPNSTIDWNVASYGSSRQAVLRVVNSTDISIDSVTFDFGKVKANLVHGIFFWDSTGNVLNNVLKNMSVDDSSGTYSEITSYLRTESYTNENRADISLINNSFIDTGRIGIVTHNYVNVTIKDNYFAKENIFDFGYAMEIGSQSVASVLNNIIKGYNTSALSDGSDSAGIYIENAFTSGSSNVNKKVIIDDNEIYGCEYGLYVGNEFNGYAGDVDIEVISNNNKIYNNVEGGIVITDEDASQGSSVSFDANSNSIINNGNYGYYVYTAGDGNIDLTILNDEISNSEYGLFIDESINGSIYSVVVNQTNISGNTLYGVYNNVSEFNVDARTNYWGDSNGPGGEGQGLGNNVSKYVLFNPWYSDEEMNEISSGDYLAPEIISTSVVINISTSEISECRYNAYDVGWENMSLFDSTNDFEHLIYLSNLVSNTTYPHYILCEDELGNRMEESHFIAIDLDENS